MDCYIILWLFAIVVFPPKLVTTQEMDITVIIVSPDSINELVLPPTGSVSLIFLPGVHELSFPVTIGDRERVSVVGTLGETIIDCTTGFINLELLRISSIDIKNIAFVGCNVMITGCNNTEISQSSFLNGTNGALELIQCFNISIDQSSFRNNQDSAFGGILEISASRNFSITRSNFTDNIISSSFTSVIDAANTTGFVSCCNFTNNSVSSFGKIVNIISQSVLFITNSTFIGNEAGSFGCIIGTESVDVVTLISSVFTSNNVGSFGGIVKSDGVSTILASDFSNNRAGGFGGTISGDTDSQITIDCSIFFNNSAFSVNDVSSFSLRNTTVCAERFAIGGAGTCMVDDCEVCRPPDVFIAIEFAEYSVMENIRDDNFALQVCVVAVDVPFQVPLLIEVTNGTAEESADFRLLSSECRTVQLAPSEGTQKFCTYIEILDDEVIEGDEQFSVRLSSISTQVIFTTKEATITIIDDDDGLATTSPSTVIPTFSESTLPTEDPTVKGGNKTVLVECGVFCREVTFPDNGNDLISLRQAIVTSFRGLKRRHIAVLQIKSVVYDGHFIDIVDPEIAIQNSSFIKVLPFRKNKEICWV